MGRCQQCRGLCLRVVRYSVSLTPQPFLAQSRVLSISFQKWPQDLPTRSPPHRAWGPLSLPSHLCKVSTCSSFFPEFPQPICFLPSFSSILSIAIEFWQDLVHILENLSSILPPKIFSVHLGEEVSLCRHVQSSWAAIRKVGTTFVEDCF